MKKVAVLRKKHPRFIYESFAYALTKNGLRITFSFILKPNILFHPEVVICGVGKKELQRISQETLDNLVFHLGLVEMLSYWKCAVSPIIEIRAGKIATGEVRFLEKLIERGMAEFFYKNNVRFSKTFVRITTIGIARHSSPRKTKGMERRLWRTSLASLKFGRSGPSAGILFPLGGGKDSLAAIEILKNARRIFRPMILGDVPAAHRLAKALHTPEPIAVRRRIDPTLIVLNKKGYLNGHTPFSAYLAFLSTLVAELFGYQKIMVANERSANEPTLIVRGGKVNHQYSKSYAFERAFRIYAKKYLASRAAYISLLRPLYELQIAGIAAQYPKGLAVAVSCNVGQKEARWCGACAKCMTVFILIFPFVKTEILLKIFGKNMLNDRSLWHFIPELLGHAASKPFDCVATTKEMQAALILSLKKAQRETHIPKLLLRFSHELLWKRKLRPREIRAMLNAWDTRNFVPRDILKTMRNLINNEKHSDILENVGMS